MSSTNPPEPAGDEVNGVELKSGFVLWRSEKMPTPGGISKEASTAPTPALVLLFTWLNAKKSQAFKYVEMYLSRGFDVLHITSAVGQFLWPPLSQKLAREFIEVLKGHCRHYEDLLVHGMSIGAYNYTTCLILADEDPVAKEVFLNRVRACVFDSLTLGTLDNMMQGIVVGVTKRAPLQRLMKGTMRTYLCATRRQTVDFYLKSVEFFRSRPAKVPTLVFASQDDPMCDYAHLKSLETHWKDKVKLPVTFQVWEKSPHCGHLRLHHDDYVRTLDDFLKSLKMISVQENVVSNDIMLKSKL